MEAFSDSDAGRVPVSADSQASPGERVRVYARKMREKAAHYALNTPE